MNNREFIICEMFGLIAVKRGNYCLRLAKEKVSRQVVLYNVSNTVSYLTLFYTEFTENASV
jgi:hypothetical protein